MLRPWAFWASLRHKKHAGNGDSRVRATATGDARARYPDGISAARGHSVVGLPSGSIRYCGIRDSNLPARSLVVQSQHGFKPWHAALLDGVLVLVKQGRHKLIR
jgi:hypothetical protein